MNNIYFIAIVIILIASYASSIIFNILKIKSLSPTIPEEMTDFTDGQKYTKSQAYTKINTKFSFITNSFSFILIMLMLFLTGFAYIDKISVSWVGNSEIANGLVFFGILFIANFILTIPFDVYDTFVIENRYGFNKTTTKIFITDKIKGLLLNIILGGLILGLIIFLYTIFDKNFWVFAWIFISFISLFLVLFYAQLIVPIFNKQTPLPAGELRTAIEEFAEKHQFKIKNIYKIDASKRSTKANAYFTGLGSRKRIVLFDTLINQLKTDEIVAVLAHEIGHDQKKHTLKHFITQIIQIGITLFIFSLFVNYPQISQALGLEDAKFHIALIAFGILYSPISEILGLFHNISSRKHEYQADNYAKNCGLANSLISGLKKLSVNSLSNLTPNKIDVFFHYSHPTLLQRIKNLKQNA